MGKDVHQIIPNKGKGVKVTPVLLGVPEVSLEFLLNTKGEEMSESQPSPEEKQKEVKAHQHQFEDVQPGKNLLDSNVEALNDQANEKQLQEAETDRVEHKKRGRKPKEVKVEGSQPTPQ